MEFFNGVHPKQIHEKLQKAFADCPGFSTVKRWCYDYETKRRSSFTDLPKSGRPREARTASQVQQVKDILASNPRHSARSIAQLCDISKDSALRIVNIDLCMRRLCSVWVPMILTENHKQLRGQSARAILDELDYLGTNVSRLYAVEDKRWFNLSPTLPKQENK